MSQQKIWDVAVAGAGAAGLMTAISARRARPEAEVLLLDGREKVGAKILMSGGTRCNVTNQNVTEKDFESEQIKIVRSVLAAFTSEKARAFFSELGVELVLEPGGKYFPSTHSGKTVLDALLREVSSRGVALKTSQKIRNIRFEDGLFQIETTGGVYHQARKVVLATGGLSFPTSGSDGTGYALARSFNHNLVPTTASLTPLRGDDPDFQQLSGVALPVRLTVHSQGKKLCAFEGDFLFTHLGYSGPAALNVSRHWIRAPHPSTKVESCFLPAYANEDRFREALMKDTSERPALTLKKYLGEKMPARFVEVILYKIGIGENTVLNQITREQRQALVTGLFHFHLPVTGDLGYAKAEVTAGGVDLQEVERLTLESKFRKGLFFAGEILDVDGRIGGFNFQWAWASGFIAGNAAVKKENND